MMLRVDDDGDNDDDELLWLTNKRHLALFPARTIVSDLQYHRSLTRHNQGLNLCRT